MYFFFNSQEGMYKTDTKAESNAKLIASQYGERVEEC